MAEVIGMDSDWIMPALKRQMTVKMSEADWTLAGIGEFTNAVKKKYGDAYPIEQFGVKAIAEWAADHDTYGKNGTMVNSWKLGKYIRSHRGVLQKSCGLYENGTSANRIMYSIQ